MTALVTHASFGAPGVGGAFYVVVSDGTRDFAHRMSFVWHYGTQKSRARESAERLLARVREAGVTVEHCAARPEFWDALTAYQPEADGSWTTVRTWAAEIDAALAGEARS